MAIPVRRVPLPITPRPIATPSLPVSRVVPISVNPPNIKATPVLPVQRVTPVSGVAHLTNGLFR
jgi:hypothetical protein